MVSLSILQTHEPKKLRNLISIANKGIRAKISAEIKEERKKFSAEMMEKRKIEKEKRIIQIPKGSKKDDLIKVIMDNKEHFKDIKKKVIKIIKDKKEPVKKEPVKKEPVAKLGESGIGKKRKRVDKPRKKKIIQVEAVDHISDDEEEKPKAKPKIKIPTITITEEEKPKKKVIKIGGRFITPKPKAEPKATPPPKSKPIKIRLPKEEKKKEDFKFEKKYLKIESDKIGSLEEHEIEYDNEKENSYIELTLTKRAKTILMIDTLSSQYDTDRPRARKGYTRAMLCHTINMLLNKNMIKLKDKVELIAGNIGGIKGGKQHNLINLVKMYESMGFVQYAQTKNQRNLESTVEKVLKWCDDKYNIKQKPKPKPKPKPKKEEAGPAEDDELKITVKPKINVKLLSTRARVNTLKQQIKELREEGKTSKRVEKELRIEELKLSKMKKSHLAI